MRDGVNLMVDVYRPDAPGKYPVLYACAMHNKDLQRVEVAENLKVGQPAWSTQWYGIIEAGDTKRLVANGYVHVIGQVRGGHKSEGMPMVGGRMGRVRHLRVDRRPALVRRQHRHDRALGLLGHAVEGRRPAAPGSQGHLPAGRDRPLRWARSASGRRTRAASSAPCSTTWA